MAFARLGEVTLHYRDEGPRHGPPLVLLHALGTDLSLFDTLIPLLPPGLRILRPDARGHGASSVPPAPYAMGALIRDAEALIDSLGIRDAVVMGVSMGGLVAQGLAVKRLDLVRGMVLSNTAARIGNAALWEARIAEVRAGGIAALSEATLARWFPRPFRDGPIAQDWRARLEATSVEGWCGAAAAIAHADFLATTATLRLPTLAIAGGHDASTPPDMVRETADLIPGSRFHLIRAAGHLPMIDAAPACADAITAFLQEIGHV